MLGRGHTDVSLNQGNWETAFFSQKKLDKDEKSINYYANKITSISTIDDDTIPIPTIQMSFSYTQGKRPQERNLQSPINFGKKIHDNKNKCGEFNGIIETFEPEQSGRGGPLIPSKRYAVSQSKVSNGIKSVTLLKELDEKRLAVRQRQIDIGKATEGYVRYRAMIPIGSNLQRRGDPKTPEKDQICSKRSWDGQISKWRRSLHAFDPKFDDSNND